MGLADGKPFSGDVRATIALVAGVLLGDVSEKIATSLVPLPHQHGRELHPDGRQD